MNDKPNTEGEQPKPDNKADKKTTIVAVLSAVSCTNPNAEHAENTTQGSDSDKKKPGGFTGHFGPFSLAVNGLMESTLISVMQPAMKFRNTYTVLVYVRAVVLSIPNSTFATV